jgi:hypothetical protein
MHVAIDGEINWNFSHESKEYNMQRIQLEY